MWPSFTGILILRNNKAKSTQIYILVIANKYLIIVNDYKQNASQQWDVEAKKAEAFLSCINKSSFQIKEPPGALGI